MGKGTTRPMEPSGTIVREMVNLFEVFAEPIKEIQLSTLDRSFGVKIKTKTQSGFTTPLTLESQASIAPDNIRIFQLGFRKNLACNSVGEQLVSDLSITD